MNDNSISFRLFVQRLFVVDLVFPHTLWIHKRIYLYGGYSNQLFLPNPFGCLSTFPSVIVYYILQLT